ncbi:MAG: hypothetical protein GTO22_07335 [Gemmatimonadales bacterium]|nr:hypothetical protein [Gemmatimonadales bacterium]
MSSRLLIGLGRHMIPIPRMLWQWRVRRAAQRTTAGLDFMSEEHHLVREFAVGELPRVGEPLSPEFIAEELDLPLARVKSILDELDKHMTFVCRDTLGAVVWAYPVTVESTPHHVTFSTGEQVHSA